jgi:hypothetical protein
MATPTRPILARQAKSSHRAVRPTIAAAAATLSDIPTDNANSSTSANIRRALSPAAAAAAARHFSRISAELTARSVSSSSGTAPAAPLLTPDDLLTLAMTKRIGAAAVKASLDLLISATAYAAAAASVAMDLDSLGLGPVTSAYAFDPLLWPRLCAIAARDTEGIVSNDATGMLLRKAMEDASRHAVILVPAPVVVTAKATTAAAGPIGSGASRGGVAGGCGDGLHWLLLAVLPAERAIECYDSRRQGADKVEGKTDGKIDGTGASEGRRGDSDDDRCWRALETVRSALVLRRLGRYRHCSSASSQSVSSADVAGSIAATNNHTAIADEPREPAGDTTEEDDDLDERSADGPWQLRIMPCAQQRSSIAAAAVAASAAANGTSARSHKAAGGSNRSGDKHGADDGGSSSEYDGDVDDDYNADGNASATYMLWFARCILLEDDARSLTQPPPPGFRRQIVRELFEAGRR